MTNRNRTLRILLAALALLAVLAVFKYFNFLLPVLPLAPGVLHALPEHHIRAGLAQAAAAAGKAVGPECFPIHISLNLSQTK